MKRRNRNSETESMKESAENIQIRTDNTKDKSENSGDNLKGKSDHCEENIKGKSGNGGDNAKDKSGNSGDNAKDKSENGGDNKKDIKDIIEEKAENDKTGTDVKKNGDEESTGTTGRTSKRKIMVPVGIFLVLTAVCGCVYSVIAFSYKEKFLPGTWVNGIECSELDGAQVNELLQGQLQTYDLEVMGRDHASGDPETLLGQVTAEDIHLTYSESSMEAVEGLLAEQNVFTWLYRKLSGDTYSFQLSQGVSYDEEQLESIVNGWEACRANNMIEPRDAYISERSGKQKGYEVIPEVEGTKFDVRELLELMDAAILSQETSLDLEAAGCYEEPEVRQDSVELTESVETANKWLGARITCDWNGTEIVVDRDLIWDWITMEKGGPVLDEKAVAAFVKEQAEENDTYGKRRSFVTTLGVELSLPSGHYGWLTDKEAETEALMEAIRQGKTVSREPVYASSARQKGMSDIGNSYVEVDLTHQHLYLYEGGTIIFETDFVSGSMSSTPDCVTPEGVFGISYKTTNAVLRGANYETPVNYWMPFYGNYGLHDATWRSEFGGQIYIENGSHGCVNLPLDAAATIYGHMSTGFPVICYYYQVDPLADQNAEEEWEDDSDDDEEE